MYYNQTNYAVRCEWGSQGALLAVKGREQGSGYSLSPASLLAIPHGTKIVLPSPNGSLLTLQAAEMATTLAGCLRNASAVAAAAQELGRSFAVIACGERWRDGGLRPAVEDLIGAGAIIQALPGSRSPEAESALAAFTRFHAELPTALRECVSGRELIARGFADDVKESAQLNVSANVPILQEAYYVSRENAP